MNARTWVAATVTGLALVLGLTFFVAVAGDPAGDDTTPAACDERPKGKAKGLDKQHPGQGKARGLDKADHPSRNGLDGAPGRSGCR